MTHVVTYGVPKQLAADIAYGAASDMHFSETLYVLAGPVQRSNYLGDGRRSSRRSTISSRFRPAPRTSPCVRHPVRGGSV